jgi:hypothetical protein
LVVGCSTERDGLSSSADAPTDTPTHGGVGERTKLFGHVGGIRPSFRVAREEGVDERGDGSAPPGSNDCSEGGRRVRDAYDGKAILSFERQAAQQQEENAPSA